MPGRVVVGTCNWNDHKPFYPPGLPQRQRLAYYARFFPLVEIDSSYYAIPTPDRTQAWASITPADFEFNIKAFRSLTYHEREGGQPREPTADEETQFLECLKPLRASGKLRAVHYQFPAWFSSSPLNLDRVSRLRERHPDDLLVVEMRNRGWAAEQRWDQLLDLLQESQISFCIVDEPQLGSGSFPPLLAVSDRRLSVVRFHGRNHKTWYTSGKTSGERFNYLYRKEELEGWRERVRELAEQAEEVQLLFNNNRSNYAVVNAAQMAELLELPQARTSPQEETPMLPLS